MARDFVFLATVGQTDIQVVVTDGGRARRYSIAKESQRAFHEACRDGRIRWTLLSFDHAELEECREPALEYHPQTNRLTTPLSEKRPDGFVDLDLTSGIELCAPLLARCCRDIRAMKLGDACHALLLTTRREPAPETEPVAVFSLVQAQLANALRLPVVRIEELVFLTEPDMYEADERGQKHLRTSAARRIDERLRELAKQYPDCVPVVSDVGGLPEPKAVVAAACVYRFRQPPQYSRPTELNRSTSTQAAQLIPPAESLTTRAAVARLVRRGSFPEAAAIARHALGDKAEKAEPWRGWLADVVAVLEGVAPRDFDRRLVTASASHTAASLRELLKAGPALLVAFRVEIALHRESWSQALRETFTFLDMAEQQLINLHYSKPGCCCLDWLRRYFHPHEAQGLPKEIHDYLEKPKCKGTKDINLYEEEELARLLRKVLPRPDQEALEGYDKSLSQVRFLRNVATHGCLDDSSIDEVRGKLEKSSLWSNKGDIRFLASPPAQRVLAALRWPRADELYRNLIEAVLHDIDAFSFQND
jgi:hypothetical protein